MSESTEKTENKPWAVRRSVNEALKTRDLPDLDEEEELEEEEEREIESGIPTNIFDLCHNLIDTKGEVVSYEIQKNSQFVAKKPHPYSWEQVQKEFGAGHYRVIARSERTKQYLKQETKFVAEPAAQEEKTSVAEAVRAAMPPTIDPFDNIAKMATLLKSLTPPPPPPVEDKSSAMMMTFMQTMMQMNQQATASTQTMMMEMQKSNQTLIERLDRSQKETLDKLEAKLAAGSGKEKGLDAIALLKLVQDAEKRGQENYARLDELAEKRARQMNGNDEDKEPETMTDKLIKSVLPAVSSALSQPRQVQAQPPQVVQRPPVRAVPPRRPVTNAIPMPKKTMSRQEALDLIMPPLGMKLLASDQVKDDREKVVQMQREAAIESRDILAAKNVTLNQLLKVVSRDDMLGIAKSVGLPDEAHTWLTEYYAHLQQLAQPQPPTSNNDSKNP